MRRAIETRGLSPRFLRSDPGIAQFRSVRFAQPVERRAFSKILLLRSLALEKDRARIETVPEPLPGWNLKQPFWSSDPPGRCGPAPPKCSVFPDDGFLRE